MAPSIQIVIDCADPAQLAQFWASALDYKIQDPPAGFASWEDFLRSIGLPEEQWNKASAVVDPDGKGPRIYFQRVPESKTVKNRVHIDLNVSRKYTEQGLDKRQALELEVERLKKLGASEWYRKEEYGEYWITMRDPEGNEFCIQ